MSYDDETNKGIVLGPTGPNKTWKVGDWIANTMFSPPVQITQDQADLFNRNQAELDQKADAAESTRLKFHEHRACPKCSYEGRPAEIHYAPDDAPCQMAHGKSEHLDRTCRRCHYTWAENCVEVGRE